MNGGGDDQALGRSRGGFGTKLHLAVDPLGNLVCVQLSPGQDADCTHAPTLLADHAPETVIADKGYDTDAVVEVSRRPGRRRSSRRIRIGWTHGSSMPCCTGSGTPLNGA
jgi:IS5 family transposase